MKAAVYYGKEDIRIKEWPDPEIGEGEALVRVCYSGLCGTDMTIYVGQHPRAKPPLVPGHEIFGRIESLGSAVGGRWKKGMRVVIYPLISCGQCAPCQEGNAHVCEKLRLVGIDRDGGFAELVKLQAGQLISIPDELGDEAAAVIEPLAVAVHAVSESSFRPGDVVLVTGAGPIGNFAAQVARAAGAREVVVSEVKSFRRDIVRRMGFATFDPCEDDSSQALERLLGRRFVDVVFEATGLAPAYRDAIQCCKVRGEICFLGIPKTPPPVDVLSMIFKEIRTTSARVYRQRDYLAAIALLLRRAIDVSPLVTRVPLQDALLAYEQMKRADTTLKILLAP